MLYRMCYTRWYHTILHLEPSAQPTSRKFWKSGENVFRNKVYIIVLNTAAWLKPGSQVTFSSQVILLSESESTVSHSEAGAWQAGPVWPGTRIIGPGHGGPARDETGLTCCSNSTAAARWSWYSSCKCHDSLARSRATWNNTHSSFLSDGPTPLSVRVRLAAGRAGGLIRSEPGRDPCLCTLNLR